MKTLKLTKNEITVLMQGVQAIAWYELPENDPSRKAAETVTRKLVKL